jgi:hypothetical protein
MVPGRTWKRVLILALCSTVLPSSPHAQTTRLPDTTELHAAYCGLVAKQDVEDIKGGLNAIDQMPLTDVEKVEMATAVRETLRRSQDNFNRLRRYFVPRLPHLDPDSVLAATDQGMADAAAEHEVRNGSCFNACGKPEHEFGQTGQTTSRCWQDCYPPGLWKRTMACRNLTWLPY